MNRKMLLVATSAALVGSLLTRPASATPELFAQAKTQGLPAKNCQYCHVSPVPQKEGYKPDDLNERGKWLMTERNKQQAKEVKADWLKQYPGAKEQ
jgi:hypothetical protein